MVDRGAAPDAGRAAALPLAYWLAPLLGMLLWPPVFVLLDALRLGGGRRR